MEEVYNKFKEYTMIPRDLYITNLILAQEIKDIEGDVVECGVWKGGMIAGIASVLGPDRKYTLFDSFEGLPPAQEIDGGGAIAWQEDKESSIYYNNCSAEKEIAEEAMKLAGVDNYEIISGWFNKTLSKYPPGESIALLRLDADWYESTLACLDNLFDKVVKGGCIIIDDYYTWDGCSRAVHYFLSTRIATQRIRSFNGVAYISK
jgi:O-methyltransferase